MVLRPPNWNQLNYLLSQESTWRLIDAYSPRVFGLFFQAFLISYFGAKAYALPGWLAGVFGLVLVLLPDPHPYILLRGKGRRATALFSLTSPSVLAKAALASTLAYVILTTTTPDEILEPHGTNWASVAAATLFFGCSEFLWAVLGTVSLCNNTVKKTALIGLAARLSSVALILITWTAGILNLPLTFLLAGLPTFACWLYLTPFSTRASRIRLFFLHGLIKFAIWLQGIALITAALLQLPVIMLGLWDEANAVTIGGLAFATRLIFAGLQPFQIMQSIVIRDSSRLVANGQNPKKAPLRALFKYGALIFIIVGFIFIAVGYMSGKLNLNASILSLALATGSAASIWYRHELAITLATQNPKYVFIYGYVPPFIISLLLTPISLQVGGLLGFSVVIVTGWSLLSTSWRWTTRWSQPLR